jgi:hypothetical protein
VSGAPAGSLRNRHASERAIIASRLLDRLVDVALDVGVHEQGRVIAVAVDLVRGHLYDLVLDRGRFSPPVTIPLMRVASIRELVGPELTEVAARLYPIRHGREDTPR